MSVGTVVRDLARHEIARASMVLVVILNVCFFPCIWGDRTLLGSAQEAPSVLPSAAYGTQNELKMTFSKTLDPGAPAWHTEPMLGLVRHQYLDEKTVPLWDPYQAFGAPLAANMQSQAFAPLTLALVLWLTPHTYSLFLLLRLFIAGLSAFLFVRYHVSFPSALCGGIATMLGGYYIVFITMPHLSVEMWLPTALLGAEYLLRKVDYGSFLCFTIVIFLSIVGGMPESSALLLTFVCLYFLFRIATDYSLRPRWKRYLGVLSGAATGGFMLAAFLLLPFLEYLRQSFNAHEVQHIGAVTGLFHDPPSQSFFTYFFPLLFGPPITDVFPAIFTGLRNYFGLIPLFMALVAVSRLALWKSKERQLNLLTAFFSTTVVLVFLKRYGFGPINIFGGAPIFNVILFTKYEELYLSVSIAVLCGIGMESLLRRRVQNATAAKLMLLTGAVIPLTLIRSKGVLARILTTQHVNLRFPALAIGIPSALLFLLALAFLLYHDERASGLTRRFATALIALISVELSANFIIPCYLVLGGMAYSSRDPYKGAPFVDFLKQKTTQQERIFGRDLVLHPDWASSFQLCDIRDLDALYYWKYLPFIHAFLPAPAGTIGTELGDRFRGEGEYTFSTPRERRLLQLSSVKYIAGTRALGPEDQFVGKILKQNAGRIEPGKEAFIRKVDLVINGLGRTALQEHPPYKRLPYELTVPRTKPDVLTFAYTVDPAVWNGPGDGAGFVLEVQNDKGEIEKVFEAYTDPKHNQKERGWQDTKVDLTKYSGQVIKLLLSTNPGPTGDSAADWADWTGFEFPHQPASQDNGFFRQVYGAEAQIFEFDEIVPRAALYESVLLVSGDEKVLRSLVDPQVDLLSTAVVDSSTLTPAERQGLQPMSDPKGVARVRAATIRTYHSRDIQIEANTEKPALFVLNDADYPGWSANVDGKVEPIITVNYLFRGLLLKPGRHQITFTYNPASFRWGAIISWFALLLLMAGWFVMRRNRMVGMLRVHPTGTPLRV